MTHEPHNTLSGDVGSSVSTTASLHLAVLALQGAFAEHADMLQRLGYSVMEIRNLADWQLFTADAPADYRHYGLLMPGGESTAMMKIMSDEGLLVPLKQALEAGMAVFGTCAGLILLDRQHLGVMNITARRNAYGRQLGSFFTHGAVKDVADDLPMTFIRAPYISETGEGVDVLAEHDGHIVAARQGHMLVTAFHPELNSDTRLHEYFLHIVEQG